MPAYITQWPLLVHFTIFFQAVVPVSLQIDRLESHITTMVRGAWAQLSFGLSLLGEVSCVSVCLGGNNFSFFFCLVGTGSDKKSRGSQVCVGNQRQKQDTGKQAQVLRVPFH